MLPAKRHEVGPEALRAAEARDRARRSIESLERLPTGHAARARALAKALEDVAAALDHAEQLLQIDSPTDDLSRFEAFVERMAAHGLAARSPMRVRREHLERCALGVAERCGVAPSEDALTNAVDYTIVRIASEDAVFGRALGEARAELRALIAAATARRPRHAALVGSARWSGNARRLVERYNAARAALFRATHIEADGAASRRLAPHRASETRRVRSAAVDR